MLKHISHYLKTPPTRKDGIPQEMWDEVLTHWERLLFNPNNEELGVRGCAFCREFILGCRSLEGFCVGCPVYEHTGEKGCKKTPYTNAAFLITQARFSGRQQSPHERKAVWLEYKFLAHLYREGA